MIYDEDDADDADKDEDLVKAQFQGRSRPPTGLTMPPTVGARGRNRKELKDLGDDPEDEWTLRKCSTAALDIFAKDHLKEIFRRC
jgi:transportin-1